MNDHSPQSEAFSSTPVWLNRKSFRRNVALTRVAVLLPFVALLDGLGAPILQLMRKARIPVSALEELFNPLPVPFAHRFLEFAVRSQGIPNLGMLVGGKTTLADLGAYGYLLRRSVTVHDYFRKGIKHSADINTGARFYLDANRNKARFSYRTVGGPSMARVHDDLFVLSVTINTIREQAGACWAPQELCIPRLPPEGVRALQADGPMENTRIVTSGDYAYFTFPVSILSLPFRATEHPHSTTPFPEAPLAVDLHGSLRQVIEVIMAQGHPQIDVVAEAAGMTRRTLQRRLAETGTSYSSIVEDARLGLASRCLGTSEMPIGQIADSLGYRDPSNFTRAFRKRTGVSPRAYRKQMLEPDDIA